MNKYSNRSSYKTKYKFLEQGLFFEKRENLKFVDDVL